MGGFANAVATTLWAVLLGDKSRADVDPPQGRTPNGFVLRRTGGYSVWSFI